MEAVKFRFCVSIFNWTTSQISVGNANCSTVLSSPPPVPPSSSFIHYDSSPPPVPPSSSFIHYDSSPPSYSQRSVLSDALVAMFALFATAFLLVSCYVTLLRCWQWRNSTRRTPQQQNPPTTDEFFLNQDAINHVWYINTVGLDESLINSINVVKFRGGEGLIEGTDCSVCLSEFQEGEDLRLLPKCSHAFHIQCVDRWLRAHTNCPLCRAPIMSNSVTGVNSLHLGGSSSLFSDTRESSGIGELSVDDEGCNLEANVIEVGGLDVEHENRNIELDDPSVILGESSRNPRMVEDSPAQFRVRRSVSMNFPVSGHVSEGLETNPGRELFSVSSGSMVTTGSSHWGKTNLESKGVDNESGGNSCEVKVVGDAEKGIFVHKKPPEMKGSFNISGSFFLPKHRPNKSSILPL